MSGHSKWNNIKNKKGAEDAKRAQVFTQLVKNIRIAAKSGGDPNANPVLRGWVDKAKEANMPKDKIQRAIDIGSGKLNAGTMQEINYECFGPGGVGMIIMAVTDNTNRTSGELRAILTRAGGSMGGPGCAAYMFTFDKEKQEFQTTMPMPVDDATREQIEDLIEKLSEVEGVEGVYTNLAET
ncbi:MAG: YebC/PmpR family DNA-binding transcriptional regulator [bacterium]|nr:YebC/PmpR family DNA-binding transcriptional regulator [bacterium]